MSERIKTIYSVNDLYTEGFGILVNYFALLQDIKNGGMFCRIQLTNITDKTICSVKVSVAANGERSLNAVGNLCVTRDMNVTVDIPLTGYDYKSASFHIVEIAYTDGSKVSIDENCKWSVLNFPETVEAYLGDEDLVREYRIHFEDSVFFPKEEKDIWFCTCGRINHKDEAACHYCKRSYASLKKYGVTELKNSVAKQKRLDAINKDKFEKAYDQVLVSQKSKRNKMLLYGVIAALIITVIVLLIAADGDHFTAANPGVYY